MPVSRGCTAYMKETSRTMDLGKKFPATVVFRTPLPLRYTGRGIATSVGISGLPGLPRTLCISTAARVGTG